MGSEKKKAEKPSPGWFKPKHLLIPLIVFPVIGIAILTYYPFHPDLATAGYSVESSPEFIGVLQRNDELNKAERLYETFNGLESTAFINDYLYAAVSTGRVVRFKGETVQTVVNCDEKATKEESKCGHPMGMRADHTNKTLYVADCIKGLYKLDLSTKKVEILYPAMTILDSKPSVMIDDLTVNREGDVYFTDASSKWGFHQMHFDFVEGTPNGRILHYDPRTKTTRVVLDKLYFPNGIQLEPGEDSFIFAESSRHRIIRYYLRGPNRGGVEIFADNLPGIPDNIRQSGRGTYWVALVIPRVRNHRSYNEMAASFPWARQVVMRAPYLITLPFQILDQILDTKTSVPMLETIDALVLRFVGGLGEYGLVLELDANGNIIRSLHSQDASVHSISQVTEHRRTLYLGSPWKNGIWKLPLGDDDVDNDR